MEFDELKKRLDSIIDKAYQGGVTLLPFLDEGEEAYIRDELSHHQTLYLYSDGKIIDSSRKRFIITPYENNNLDFKIVVYKIIYNKKFYEMNHRSILGSLMGLGIKRECIGDIVIEDNKDSYFAVTEEISPFIKNELRQIGKCQIDLMEYDKPINNIIKYETKTTFVSSLRLDSVVSLAIGKSRGDAQDLIYQGLVTLNYKICQNNSEVIREGDSISVRHHGKYLISHVGGKSKSGRTIIDISKRL